MLRILRDHAGNFLIKIILGAIVIVFVFWGVGSYRSQRMNTMASVNGDAITMEEYRQSYNNLVERYRQQFGDRMDENMIQMLGLRRQALDQLVEQALLRQKASDLNFRVSDEELAESIQEIPAFQNNGQFDSQLYNRVLGANRLSPEEFEVLQRDALLVQKLRSFIMENVKVSENEAFEWYQWNNASMNISYVLFAPSDYTDIELTDEEIKTYYEEHTQSYMTEPKAKAQYVRFSPDTFIEEVTVTDEEIKDYYELNPDEFKEPKTVEARHILFTTGPDSTPEEIEEKKKKAEEVLEMARAEGADFGELAKEYSEGPSKDRGGDLGAFTKDRMVKPFADKAFSMEAGEISEPVKTQFGWHIIKVEKVNEASEQSLEEAAEEIRKKLAQEKAKSMAYDQAETFYDSVYEGDDLKEVAQPLGVEVTETDIFTAAGPEGVPNPPAFAQTALDLEPLQISPTTEFGDSYFVIQTTEKIEPSAAPLEDVKEKVRADLLRQRQEEKAREKAAEFLTEVNGEESWSSAVSNLGLDPQTTGFFERNGSIPDIGQEREIAQAAFELSNTNPLPRSPIKGRKGYYVIRFEDKKLPDEEAFEREKKQVKQRLLQQKQFKTFNNWLAQVKDQSEIEILVEDAFLN